MRTRVRSKSSLAPFHQGYEWHSGGSMSNNYGLFSPGYGTSVKTTDVVTDNFRKKIADGNIVMSPYESTRLILSGTPVSYRTEHSSGQFWFNDGNCTYSVLNALGKAPQSSAYTAPIVFGQQDISDLESEVSTAVLSQVGRPQVNNWENLFQISKTINELRHPFQNFKLWSDRFVSKAVARKAGKPFTGPRGSKVKMGVTIHPLTPANLWLQYRYGVRLLIKDIEDVLKQLDRSKVDGNIQRFTTRKKRTISASQNTSGTTAAGVGIWNWSQDKSESVTVRAMSIEDIQVDLAFELGLTGSQLLTVAWELLPYSFVADWFVNVGELINSLAPSPVLRSVGRCIVTKRTSQILCVCTPANVWSSGYRVTGLPGSMTNTTVHTKRLVGLNHPQSLLVKSDFRLSDPTRAADAAALALTAFDRAWGKDGILRNLHLNGAKS